MLLRNDDPAELDFITEGPILKSLMKLAWPIMISQFMQTLYNLVDTLWVGRVGATAVAAISISFPLVFLLISIAAGLTIAGTAIIAQYKGAGQIREANRVMGQMFSFIILLAVIIGITGFIFSRKMIIMMGAEPLIVDDATGYIRVIFMGMPFMFGFFIFSSVLRGIGDTVTPAVMMFVSVVLNMILDPLLIFGIGFFPELGVQGAAVATIFSRAVVAVVAVFLLIKGVGELQLRSRDLKPNFSIIKLIARIGIPSSIEQSMISLGQLFMTVLVTSFGTMTLAAYGIVNRVASLPVILAFGLAASATTMVGQNIGAEEKARAERTAFLSILTIFISLTAIGVIMVFIPEYIVGLFNSDPEVLFHGGNYLRIVALTFGFVGAMHVTNGVFKGAGRTVPPMIISTISQWVLRFMLGYFLARILNWGEVGLWWAVAAANFGGALLAMTWLKLTNWSTKIIKSKNKIKKAFSK